MQRPTDVLEVVLSRSFDGRIELVHWIRDCDTVWIVSDSHETIIGPDAWKETWAELHSRGFLEVYPNDERKLAAEKDRVLALVRNAFRDVILGNGVGLRQGQGLDDYADERTLASYRAQDEKSDWSANPVADLDQYYSSLSFFDAEGMRFHLPAYLVADLEDSLQTADPLFHLVYTGPGAGSRFDTLSPAQHEAVRQFLLLRLLDNHRQFDHPMIYDRGSAEQLLDRQVGVVTTHEDVRNRVRTAITDRPPTPRDVRIRIRRHDSDSRR